MSTTTAPIEMAVRGPFDLAASTRFLEGFAPAARPDAAAEPGLLRLAFPAETGWAPVGAAVRQHNRRVTVELTGDTGDQDAVLAQVERILSLDVDGSGFLDVGRRDPVVSQLQSRPQGCGPYCSTLRTRPPAGPSSASASGSPRPPSSRRASPTSWAKW